MAFGNFDFNSLSTVSCVFATGNGKIGANGDASTCFVPNDFFGFLALLLALLFLLLLFVFTELVVVFPDGVDGAFLFGIVQKKLDVSLGDSFTGWLSAREMQILPSSPFSLLRPLADGHIHQIV